MWQREWRAALPWSQNVSGLLCMHHNLKSLYKPVKTFLNFKKTLKTFFSKKLSFFPALLCPLYNFRRQTCTHSAKLQTGSGRATRRWRHSWASTSGGCCSVCCWRLCHVVWYRTRAWSVTSWTRGLCRALRRRCAVTWTSRVAFCLRRSTRSAISQVLNTEHWVYYTPAAG